MFNPLIRYLFARSTLGKKQKSFLNLITPPNGSYIHLKIQQKQQINKQIDIKMKQLQSTGLSKQQILLSNAKKGLPLKIDPFFQFLKRNKLARQIYLKPHDRFCVQKVIDIALRQDIGPDPSYSRPKLPYKVDNQGRMEFLNNLNQPSIHAWKPQNFYSNRQFTIQNSHKQIYHKQPIKYIFKPIDKYERVKTHQRKLKKYDINWRNIQLIQQFLTINGNIKNRLINCISRADQKRICKAVKTARHMFAIPHYGRTLPSLKRNITNIQDQVQQIGLHHVNVKTGHIFLLPKQSMDYLEVQYNQANDPDKKYKKMLQKGMSYKLWQDSIQNQITQEDILAQKFARYLKKQQLQKKVKKTNKQVYIQRMMKIPNKIITGLTQEEQIQQQELIDNSDKAKATYNLKAEKIKESLNKNPYLFSDILLKQKLELS